MGTEYGAEDAAGDGTGTGDEDAGEHNDEPGHDLHIPELGPPRPGLRDGVPLSGWALGRHAGG